VDASRRNSEKQENTKHAWVDFEEDPDVNYGKFAQQAKNKMLMKS